MSVITLPCHLTFQDWVYAIQLDLNTLTIPNPPRQAKDWQQWAVQMISANPTLPMLCDPTLGKEYKNEQDWQKWAEIFISIVYNI